ncbi:MAG TPA: glycosyltransferase family 39 protein [Prolixibacteraceae bacterium]|nr:glycosyltransferase family 39 protein [Prolixibacteraceae bacterium]
MFKNRQQTIIFIVTALILLIALVAGLLIDVTRDASKYAYISKLIASNNQWINLQIDGEPYDQKPHLMFWLSALSFKIFGFTNFAFKLPILLYSFLGLFFVYKLGNSCYNKNIALLATIMSAFSILFILYNQDLHTDTLLFTNTAFALWQLYEYIKTKRTINIIGAGIALGLCLLTKGPYGVLLPFLCVVLFLVINKKWSMLINFRWLIIMAIAFFMALPVFYQLYLNWGIKGISFFFLGNTWGRFTGSYLGHTPDPTFYLHNLAYLFIPWSLIFFLGLYQLGLQIIKKKASLPDKFFFWGLLMFFLLLSISISKLPNYMMAALPVMAIITSKYWIENIQDHKTVVKIQHVIITILWILALIILIYFVKTNLILAISILITTYLAIIFITKRFSKPDQALYRSLATVAIIGLLLNLAVLPILFGHQAQPKAAKYLNQYRQGDTPVFDYPKKELKYIKHLANDSTKVSEVEFKQTPAQKHFSLNYELKFYCHFQVQYIEKPEELEAALMLPEKWFYTDEEGKNELLHYCPAPDTIINYQHFSLKRTAKYFIRNKQQSAFVNRYLLKISIPQN